MDAFYVQAQPLSRYQENYSLGKFHFNQDQCHFPRFDEATIYIAPESCVAEKPENITLLEQTYLDDDITPGFALYKLRKN